MYDGRIGGMLVYDLGAAWVDLGARRLADDVVSACVRLT
jgi:hypothetical protein